MNKIACFLLIALAPPHIPGDNFVGVKKGECPWAVRVLKLGGDGKITVFTGSLIDPSWILTSASCCTQSESNQYRWKVLLSATCQTIVASGIELDVLHCIPKPEYNIKDKKTWGNDIGLVQLKTAVRGKNIHLAKLPKAKDEAIERLGQMGGYAPSGMAQASNKFVKPVEMPVYPSGICPAFYWLGRQGYGFCAGNRQAADVTQISKLTLRKCLCPFSSDALASGFFCYQLLIITVHSRHCRHSTR
ncbi:trypsin, partial [Opisthorchis viverrini]